MTTTEELEEFPQNVCPEICAVCGDKATGYHYDVPSCNGCKLFYRRTVVAKRKFTCKQNGKCFENKPKKGRVECRACRFKACVNAGMNSQALQLVDEEKAIKSKKTLALMRKRVMESQPSTSKEMKISPAFTTFEDSVEKLLDQLTYIDARISQMRRSQYNPDPFAAPGIRELLLKPTVMTLVEIHKPMQDWPIDTARLSHPSRQKYISRWEEWQKFSGLPIEELKEKMFDTSKLVETDGEFNWAGRYQQPAQEVNLADFQPLLENNRKLWIFFDLLCTLEYAKTFSYFNELDIEDRIILMKHVALLCTNLTQSFYAYSQKSQGLLFPDGTNPPEIFTRIHSKTSAPLIRTNIDSKEYSLLKALTLCNAAVPGISYRAQQILNIERDKLALSLLSYCMANKGTTEGPTHYYDILGIVTALQSQAQDLRDLHLLIQLRYRRIPQRVLLVDEVFT